MPNRREALRMLGSGVLAAGLARPTRADEKAGKGCVVGHAQGALAGQEVLEAGGNAVDAAVTSALVAGVVALPGWGFGGYGGHMTIALAGKKVTSIDFNTAAPAAAKPDMYPLD